MALSGRRTVLVPEAEAHDAAFEDEREFQRKVRTLAGNYQLFARLPAPPGPAVNPIWFETFSHKILRLVAPWLLVAAGRILSLAGAGRRALDHRRAARRAGRVLRWRRRSGPRSGRIAALARTFVVLNLAAVLGLWRFLTGRQRITW